MTINRFEAPYGYVAIKDTCGCKNCFFDYATDDCEANINCNSWSRKDNFGVIFKPIDNHYFIHTESDTQPKIVNEFFDEYPFGKVIAYYKDYMNSVQCLKGSLYIIEWDKVKYFRFCV